MATIGGDDQITVLKHSIRRLPAEDPKPVVGYPDSTNVLNWLWYRGVGGVHGGSTQFHLGPGPRVDERRLVSLRAALFGHDDCAVFAPSQGHARLEEHGGSRLHLGTGVRVAGVGK